MAMNENVSPDPREQNSYGTGNTHPPKSQGGWIAVFFAAVIFLGGIVSGLSLMGIRMSFLNSDAPEEKSSVQFSHAETLPTTTSTVPAAASLSAGFTGQALTLRDQIIFKLPGGIYITKVHSGSDAQKKGISPGDVLVRLGETATSDLSALNTALNKYRSGDEVEMVIYRGGVQHLLRVTLCQGK